jgi:hypothetical protein
MSSSVGMMTFPTEWKNEIHVPNHQPDKVWVWESLRGILWPILWESYDVNIDESDHIMRRL